MLPTNSNAFESLARHAETLAISLRSSGGQPLDEFRHALLTGAIDDVLGSLEAISATRIAVGDHYECERPPMYRPATLTGVVQIEADDELLDWVCAENGWVDQFADPGAVRDALESLLMRQFEIERIAAPKWTPIGLLALVQEVVERVAPRR